MQLTADEEAMLAGKQGEAVRRALEMQRAVGDFFQADRFVPISSAHVMAEIESMGDAGLAYVEEMADLGAVARVPTTINPRSVDFEHWEDLGQDVRQYEREMRLSRALEKMHGMTLNTCINYQTIVQPQFGEHLAWGDTGTVIYANAVAGARTNFEGGPVALAAAITGRTPNYGYHRPEQRRGTVLVEVEDQPQTMTDWGALGGVVGRRVSDYWQVPVITGVQTQPDANDIKHLGASLASYGSLAMFHLVGVTPEARTIGEAFAGQSPSETVAVPRGSLKAFYRSFAPEKPEVDVVVFGTPQLSVFEMQELAHAFVGKRVAPNTRLIFTTNYQNREAAQRLGHAQILQEAGGLVLSGVCFYLVTARELALKFGYRTLVTNSAKLANIIAGYGYNPIFRPTDVCVRAALTGRLDEE